MILELDLEVATREPLPASALEIAAAQ